MRKDLTKQCFGDLTVEEFYDSKNGRVRWLCRCECGNTCIVYGSNLTSGHTTSCGCKKQQNLAGKQIGMLEVIERADVRISRGKRTSPTWKCRCKCGAIVYRATDTLTNSDANACPECARKYAVKKMRDNAGFVDGTQISKITDMKLTAANTSGVRGVSFDKNSKKWRATIIFKRKKYHLGLFSDFDMAVDARKKAEKEYFGNFLEGKREKEN